MNMNESFPGFSALSTTIWTSRKAKGEAVYSRVTVGEQ